MNKITCNDVRSWKIRNDEGKGFSLRGTVLLVIERSKATKQSHATVIANEVRVKQSLIEL